MQYLRIQARVRDNTGWSNVNDLSTTRLQEAINWSYTRKIPNDLNWQGLQDWIYFDLADGTDSYAFDTAAKDAAGGTVIGTRVRSIIPPTILIVDSDNAAKINLTHDHVGFWEEYPPYTNESEGQPIIVLEQSRVLYPRPIPDTSYTLQCMANWRPADLSGNTDEPVEDWAELIIACATANILEDDEDQDAAYWWSIYEHRKENEIANDQSRPQSRVKQHW